MTPLVQFVVFGALGIAMVFAVMWLFGAFDRPREKHNIAAE